MATNEILPFCPTDTGTNLLTEIEYAAATGRDIGNQPGIASSKLNNKALRQATFMVAQLAQYLGDKTGSDVLDDGDDAALLAIFMAAFFYKKIQALTATGNISASADIVELGNTTSYTATLPDPTTNAGKSYCVRMTGASGVKTLSPAIDGITVTLDNQYQFINIYSNGVTYGVCG